MKFMESLHEYVFKEVLENFDTSSKGGCCRGHTVTISVKYRHQKGRFEGFIVKYQNIDQLLDNFPSPDTVIPENLKLVRVAAL